MKTPADTLVVGIEAAPLTLDPRLASDAYSSKLSRLIHNGLFRLSERLEIVPELAERFENPIPQLYRVHLRSGVRFHDGRPFTAEDVKYTLESTVDPALASPFRGTMEKIESIDVLDPLTLDIRLKEPFSPFLAALTMGIVPKDGDPKMGTGPFVFASMTPNEEVRLRRNDEYFGEKAKTAHLRFRVITDDNLRLLELKNGRIDVLQNNVPPALIPAVKEDKNLVLTTTEGVNMTYLGMNVREGPLSKPEVREAIVRALDIPALIDYRMSRLARPATGILAPIHWAYEPDVSRYDYDPSKARELMDRAGFPDPDGAGPRGRLSLTYKTSTKKDRIGLARLMARYLKDIGIEVKVLPYDWGVFFHDVNAGNFELYSLTWVGVTEPDIYYYAFHSSQIPPTGANRGAYRNASVDQLTEEGRRESDPVKRKELYSAVQKVLSQDLPIIPLWYENNYAVFSRRVQGLRLRPDASFGWAAEVVKR